MDTLVQRYGYDALLRLSLVNIRMMMLDRVEFLMIDQEEECDDVERDHVDNVEYTAEGMVVNGK